MKMSQHQLYKSVFDYLYREFHMDNGTSVSNRILFSSRTKIKNLRILQVLLLFVTICQVSVIFAEGLNADANSLLLTGSRNTSGAAWSIDVQSQYAYVADYTTGLKIIDISIPSNPVLVSSLDTNGTAWSVSVAGEYAYIADGFKGLKIINVSTPSIPFLAGAIDTNQAHSVSVLGRYAYVADGLEGLKIIDISIPSNPVLVGRFNTNEYAHFVSIKNQYIYLIDGREGVKVINISDPTRPVLVSIIGVNHARSLSIKGENIYISDGWNGLKIFDISNLSSPVFVGGIDTNGFANSVRVISHFAYVADGSDGLKVIDVTDPSSPAIAGSLNILINHAQSLVVNGHFAYVADNLEGLKVIDIRIFNKTKKNDFDNDGHSDILLRNSISGLNKIYLMNGKSITTDANFAYAGEASWEVAGIGDFDDDGNDDILWRNSVSTLNHIAFMSGTTVDGSKSADFNGLPDTNWKVVGIGDFNNDRFDDILWRNDVTGENRLFLMQGTTILSELFIDSVPDNNWKVAGVADFNFDKKADILWRHDVNRRVWLYLMDSNTITNGAGVGEHIAFTSENWDIQGVGDSNDDGKSDILWRHNVNGRVWMYLMDGTTILNSTGSAPGEHVAFTALAWEIKATGDYNGDGKDDVFWRHSVSGDNWMYLLDGVRIIDDKSVNSLSDLNWSVKGY